MAWPVKPLPIYLPEEPDDGLARGGLSGQFLSSQRPRRADSHRREHQEQHDRWHGEVPRRRHDLKLLSAFSPFSCSVSLTSELARTLQCAIVCFDALLIAAPINHLYTAENTRIWSAEKLLARYVGDLARSFELYSSRTPSRRYLNIKILGIFSDSDCTVDLCPG